MTGPLASRKRRSQCPSGSPPRPGAAAASRIQVLRQRSDKEHPVRVLFTPWAKSPHYFPQVPVAWALRNASHEVRVAC